MELFNNLYEMGSKEAGSPAGNVARGHIVDYLQARFPQFRIKRELFLIERNLPIEAKLVLDQGVFSTHLYENTGVSGGVVEGNLLRVGFWSLLFPGKRFRGKILIIRQRAILHRVWVIKRAYEQGAVAVILVSRLRAQITSGLGYPYVLGSCDMPAIGIKKQVFQQLKLHKSTSAKIKFSTEHNSHLKCENIVMENVTEHNKDRPTIVLGAHYDSWYGGAHDNCIAVQMMTDVFEALSKRNLRHPIRAIYFDAEEVGLTGSRYHVSHLQGPEIAFYFNFEMPIPSQRGRLNTLFYSGDALSRNALRRIPALKLGLIPLPLGGIYKLFTAFPADLDDFYKKGIPCMSTYCSNPYAHTELDTPDNLRLESYPSIRNLITETVCEVDRAL